MEKIEDIKKRQVSFSRRCGGLIKSVNEITDSCEADAAFLAFYPSSSISKYSSQRRIKDVLHRYVNLPADKRLNHIPNVQEKIEKLKQIAHIKGDNSKLHFLQNQVENLELQIKTRDLELQTLEADLRKYEQCQEQEPSLQQLSCCERNLQHSLEIVMARKNAMLELSSSNQQPIFQNLDLMDQMEIENQDEMPLASNFNENDLTSAMQNLPSSQILMQLDPWTSPYSEQVRVNMLQNLLDEAKLEPVYNPLPSNISNFPLASSSALFGSGTELIPEAHIPPAACIQHQQSSIADQYLLNFPDQTIDSWTNLVMVASSDGNQKLVQNPSNFMPPRFTSTTEINTSDAGMPRSQYYTSMQGNEIGQMLPNMDFSINFSNGSGSIGNGNNENGFSNFNDTNNEDNFQASYIILPPEEVGQDELFGNLPTDQDILADICPSKTQKTGELWEWEDLPGIGMRALAYDFNNNNN